MVVNLSVQDNVGIIQIRNPPVNALSLDVIDGLVECLEKAQSDPLIHVLLLCGEGKIFCGGADIKQFKNRAENATSSRRSLVDVGLKIARCPKPVIVAVSGVAFGGGMELALWCDYRIIHKDAKVGQTEVLLGIMPGAGGSVILPRLVGIPQALDIVTSGRHLTAEEAFNIGIFQKLVMDNVFNESFKFSKMLTNKPYAKKFILDLPIKDAEKVDNIIKVFQQKNGKKWKNVLAPNSCVEGVRGAVTMPPLDALKYERELFMTLLKSDQAKALQYSFFAERLAPKSPLITNMHTVKPQIIHSIGVIGAGTMGSGIANCCLRANFNVILVEVNEKALEAGVTRIQADLKEGVRRKKFTQAQMDKMLLNLKSSTSLDSLSNVDLVIEAIFESMELKKNIFSKLDSICKESAILCSNTSGLNIDEMAGMTKRPDKVAGMHFFAPAHIMKLLENVQGKKSSLETLSTITSVGSALGKIPVLVKNCPGFCGNRMYHPYINESRILIEQGPFPHEVDQVLEDFGFAMGPFKVQDLSGLDVGYLIHKSKLPPGVPVLSRFINGVQIATLGLQLVELGRLGQKSGKGWYKYVKGAPVIDDEINNKIIEFSKTNDILRRKITPQEIFERCLYPLINEGFNLLEEGIVTRPQDIDTIFLHGYGWPRHSGGPMFMASTIGLKKLYKSISQYQKLHVTSSYWQPSELLRRMSEKDVPLDQWSTFLQSKL